MSRPFLEDCAKGNNNPDTLPVGLGIYHNHYQQCSVCRQCQEASAFRRQEWPIPYSRRYRCHILCRERCIAHFPKCLNLRVLNRRGGISQICDVGRLGNIDRNNVEIDLIAKRSCVSVLLQLACRFEIRMGPLLKRSGLPFKE